MLNTIYLRRKNKIILPSRGKETVPVTVLSALNKNLESLGYTLSIGVLNRLRTLDMNAIEGFYSQLVADLKVMKGVRSFNPMYPNFPQQVMEASGAELYINAVFHYFSAFVSDVLGTDTSSVWLPHYDKKERLPLLDTVKLTVISLGDEEDFTQMFVDLMNSKTSISEVDKTDLTWFLQTVVEAPLPKVIPNKEVLAVVGAALFNTRYSLLSYFKTATDVLRLACALSGGDVSLALPTKFCSFKRNERRALLNLLNNAGSLDNLKEDMLRWKMRWIKLGNALHPTEYRKFAPKAAKAFDAIRNHAQDIETFNSRVHSAIANAEIDKAIAFLKDRPGVFARKLDHLLRIESSMVTVRAFEKVAASVSTPVLLQVLAHFKHRNDSNSLRVFFPKENLAKVQGIENNLPPLRQKLCGEIVEVCEETLRTRFAGLPSLGKCYIDSNLQDYLVPFSQRSASKSLKTVVRGSKIPFADDKDTIRFFIWWNEKGGERVDLDLSAVMFGENWTNCGHVAYTNLRYGYDRYGKTDKYASVHSGDITSAPNGACEFIDIHIPSMLASGTRYIAMSVNSYTQQPFKDIPEAQAGWMLREYPNSGEVFDARTVEDKLDLTNENKFSVPMIIDLQDRKIIWMDMGVKQNAMFVNNVRSNLSSIAMVGKSFTQLNKPTLHELFKLHAEARGRIVKNFDSADTAFVSHLTESVDINQVTPFDMETIVGKYL